jgi:hypothetical protein
MGAEFDLLRTQSLLFYLLRLLPGSGQRVSILGCPARKARFGSGVAKYALQVERE